MAKFLSSLFERILEKFNPLKILGIFLIVVGLLLAIFGAGSVWGGVGVGFIALGIAAVLLGS